MIKQLLTYIWQVIDVLLFLSAMIVADIAAFRINETFGLFAVAISLVLVGFMTEIISAQRKGGD